MPDGKIRALCAQIALEIDPAKADALIANLRRLLNGEDVPVNRTTDEKLTALDFIPQRLLGRNADTKHNR